MLRKLDFISKRYFQALVMSGCLLLAFAVDARVLIDNFNNAQVTSCFAGVVPTYGNAYRLRNPGGIESERQRKGQCNVNNFYGIGDESDWTNEAHIDNEAKVISLWRTYWLNQALSLNVVGDSSILTAIYDGKDTDPVTNAHALGGVDLTVDTDNVFRINVVTSTAEAVATITLYENDTDYSSFQIVLPNTQNVYQDLDIFLDDFVDTAAGADFSSVESIKIELVNTDPVDPEGSSPIYLGEVIPNAAAYGLICSALGDQCQQPHYGLGIDNAEVTKQLDTSMTVDFIDDHNADGDFDSADLEEDSDTFRYTVTITNTDDLLDADATNVVYSADFAPSYASFVPETVTVMGQTLEQEEPVAKGTVTEGNTVGDTEVIVDIGTIADGEVVTITYDMQIEPTWQNTPDVSFSHHGNINADEWAAYDTEPLVIDFNQFDISTTLTVAAKDDADSDTFSGPGERVTFTATVDNYGPNTTRRLKFYFPEIPNATLVEGSVQSSLGSTVNSDSVEIEITNKDFAPSTTDIITFDVEIDDPFIFDGDDRIGGQALLVGELKPDDKEIETFFGISDDPSEPGASDPTFIQVDAFPNRSEASEDSDGDGLPENCDPACGDEDANPNDTDNDGTENISEGEEGYEEADNDGDGVNNGEDAFPYHDEASTDTDGDGMPDSCINNCVNSGLTEDPDDDNDGVNDVDDDFPLNNAAAVDTDGDGMPDEWLASCNNQCKQNSGLTLDNDDDNDGVPDDEDDFPQNAAASIDTDGDGMPDEWLPGCNSTCQGASGLTLDDDDDNDGVPDASDAFPLNEAASLDADEDGMPDVWNDGSGGTFNCDQTCQNNSGLTLDPSLNDRDNDGVVDEDDAFPLNNAASVDGDSDGLPDEWNASCDSTCQNNSGLTLDLHLNDSNNDGVPNNEDDDDGDGIPNGEDTEPTRDNNPPVVIAPADRTVDANGTLTAVSLGSASAEDFLDGELTPSPDKRGPFPVGVHVITWTATDAAGNVGTDTQTITVVGESTEPAPSSGGGGSLGMFALLILLVSTGVRITSRRLYS